MGNFYDPDWIEQTYGGGGGGNPFGAPMGNGSRPPAPYSPTPEVPPTETPEQRARRILGEAEDMTAQEDGQAVQQKGVPRWLRGAASALDALQFKAINDANQKRIKGRGGVSQGEMLPLPGRGLGDELRARNAQIERDNTGLRERQQQRDATRQVVRMNSILPYMLRQGEGGRKTTSPFGEKTALFAELVNGLPPDEQRKAWLKFMDVDLTDKTPDAPRGRSGRLGDLDAMMEAMEKAQDVPERYRPAFLKEWGLSFTDEDFSYYSSLSPEKKKEWLEMTGRGGGAAGGGGRSNANNRLTNAMASDYGQGVAASLLSNRTREKEIRKRALQLVEKQGMAPQAAATRAREEVDAVYKAIGDRTERSTDLDPFFLQAIEDGRIDEDEMAMLLSGGPPPEARRAGPVQTNIYDFPPSVGFGGGQTDGGMPPPMPGWPGTRGQTGYGQWRMRAERSKRVTSTNYASERVRPEADTPPIEGRSRLLQIPQAAGAPGPAQAGPPAAGAAMAPAAAAEPPPTPDVVMQALIGFKKALPKARAGTLLDNNGKPISEQQLLAIWTRKYPQINPYDLEQPADDE